MARGANTNYQASGTEFELASDDADTFDRNDVYKLAKAVDEHTHASTRGLGVKRIQTADVPGAAGEVRVNGDTLQFYGSALQTTVKRGDFGTPAVVLGAAPAAGSSDSPLRADCTIEAFDATAPVTQAMGDAAGAGAAAKAARRDHQHGMPSFGASASTQAFGDAADGGVAATPSRSDHVHGMPDGPVVIARVNTPEINANNAAEATMLTATVEAGTLGTTGVLKGHAYGRLITGLTNPYTFRVRAKFGGTTFFDYTFPTDSLALGFQWELELKVTNMNAANAQRASARLLIGGEGSSAAADVAGAAYAVGGTTLAVDTSAAKDLVVTITNSDAFATIISELHGALMERW